MPRILIVDDEANLRRMVAALLEAEGHTTVPAADAESAVEAMRAAEAVSAATPRPSPRPAPAGAGI